MDEMQRVLLVEDNPGYVRLMQAMLIGVNGTTFELVHVDRLAKGLEQLRMNGIDLVLLDLSLPDSQGLETFTQLYAQVPQVPVIVLTSLDDEALAVEAVRGGAQDYLVKGEVEGSLLRRAMHYAIERNRAERELKRRNQELAALNAIGVAVNQSMELEEALDAALQEALAVLEVEGGLIYLFDPASQVFVPVVQRGISQTVVKELSSFKVGEGLSGWVAEAGRALVVTDLSADSRNVSAAAARAGWRSFAGVPLQSKGQVLGVMSLVSRRRGYFKTRHRELLTHIGNQVGIAVENVRLYEAERQRATQLAGLTRASQVVTATLDLDRVLSQIISLATEVTGSDYTSVILVDEEGEWGQSADNLVNAPAIPHRAREKGVTRWVLDSRQATIFEIEKDGTIFPELPGEAPEIVNSSILEAGVRSVAALPLISQNRLLGVLYLHSLHPAQFNNQLPVLTIFAGQMAIAIENAQLFRQAQQELTERKRAEKKARQRTEQMLMVHSISQVITSNLERDQVIETILSGIKRVLEVDACSLLLYEQERDELVFEASSGAGANEVVGMRLKVGQGIAGWVALTGQPALVPDVGQDPRFCSAVDEATELVTHSVVATPIEIQGRRAGVIEVVSLSDRRFDNQDLDLLSILSDTAAVAIHNAQLYQEIKQYSSNLEGLVAARTEELREAKERAETILQSAGDPILLTDVSGQLLTVNPAFEKQSGFSAQATSELNLNDLVKTEKQEIWEEIQEAAQSSGRWRGEALMQRKDGSTYEADLSVGTTYDQAGEITGFVGSIRDISKLKEVDRLKDQFVSDVSHELRTPLTNIKLYLHLMERADASNFENYLDILVREQRRLEHLIEQLLDLSRLDLGSVQANRRTLDVDLVVRSLVEDRKALARAQGLELDVASVVKDVALELMPEGLEADLSEPLPLVLADERMLVQVLDNLIVNAIQYTPAPGKVTVYTGCYLRDGREWITISVSDTGLGIPLDELDQIFERFYRGESAYKSGAQGTGLGLAICREIVERHQGHIDVQSERGLGSTFTVHLPVADDEALQKTERSGSAKVREETTIFKEKPVKLAPRETSGPRVLVVEDETQLLRGLYEALTANGYRVWAAQDGQAGLELLEEARPDLIISDIMMPHMDGFEFCESVRARPQGITIPFIFLTAKGQTEARRRGLELGAEDYVVKPFDLDELLHLVEVRLQRSAELRAVQQSQTEELRRRISTMLGHEFRTPLSYITAYTSLLSQQGEGLDEAQFRRMLTGIQSGTERLNKLVMDFLLLVDLETEVAAKNYRVNRSILQSPRDLVVQIVKNYRPQAQEAGVTLQWELDEELAPIVADVNYFSDGLGRLLDNAIKFTRPTGGQVLVRGAVQDDELRIAVNDEGIGIPADQLEQIFMPFYQVDRERREQSGVGLGLAIAKGVIELHEGGIEVESQVDEGSSFVISLPVLND